MPLRLTNPINPGDLDPGRSYTHAQIESFAFNRSQLSIDITVTFGSMDAEERHFEEGALAPDRHYTLTGDAVLLLLTIQAVEGDTIYNQVAEKLYEYLIMQGELSGIVV